MSLRDRLGRALGRPGSWLGALALGALLVVYLQGTKRDLLDSRYALLTSESLLSRGSWDLTPYLERPSGEEGEPRRRRWVRRRDDDGGDGGDEEHRGPYQLLREGEARLYYFPPGTPLLSVPLLALARPFGYGVLHPDGRYAMQRERELQELLAALLATLAVGLIYRAARREVPAGWALAVAASAAFGTSLWSVASRVLWSHSWSVVLLAGAWLELLRWEDGERPRPVLLGCLLSAAFWVRPTNALVALAVVLVAAMRHRRALPALIGTGAAGLAAFVATSFAVWHQALPPYFSAGRTAEIQAGDALDSIVGLLISPTRGLLAFTPLLLLVPVALLIWGVPRPRRLLAAAAAAIVVAHLALYSVWQHWWAGASYGPRILADTIPFLVWLGALAIRAGREGRRARWLRPALVATALPLLAWSALSHGAGVYSRRIVHVVSMSGGWNDPDLLWRWRRAPALQQLRAWSDEAEPRRRRRRPRRAVGPDQR